MVKNLPAMQLVLGSIPGSGRSPGEGNGNLLQYSSLEHPMERGAWRATVHGVAESWTWLSDWHFLFFTFRGWEEGVGSYRSTVTGLLFGVVKFWRSTVATAAQHSEHNHCHEFYTLNAYNGRFNVMYILYHNFKVTMQYAKQNGTLWVSIHKAGKKEKN